MTQVQRVEYVDPNSERGKEIAGHWRRAAEIAYEALTWAGADLLEIVPGVDEPLDRPHDRHSGDFETAVHELYPEIVEQHSGLFLCLEGADEDARGGEYWDNPIAVYRDAARTGYRAVLNTRDALDRIAYSGNMFDTPAESTARDLLDETTLAELEDRCAELVSEMYKAVGFDWELNDDWPDPLEL